VDSLTEYLGGLAPDQLAHVITRRSESVMPPEPGTLTELAERLTTVYAMGSALIGLTLPAVQILETLTILGDGFRRDDLCRVLGLEDDDPHLATVLSQLAERALAWPEQDKIRVAPLNRLFPHPHGLGCPLSALLDPHRTNELKRIAKNIGVPVYGDKPEIIHELVQWLSRGENVRDLVATAPKQVQQLLETLAWKGPILDAEGYYGAQLQSTVRWASERGLLGSDGSWDSTAEIPGEVALALRGPDYRFPFDGTPPVGGTVPVGVDLVEREAAATAGTAVAMVAAALDEGAKRPIAILKTGGVGIRELRRLSKNVGETVERMRFWLELSFAAGLAGTGAGGLLPTEAYDDWSGLAPADQLLTLVTAWGSLPGTPLYPPTDAGPNAPAFSEAEDGSLLPVLREAVVAVAAGGPVGQGIPLVDQVVPLVRWLRPFAANAVEDLAPLVKALWQEAELLGLIAHGAASGLCRALDSEDQTALYDAALRMMPDAQTSVLLQADLTAVATGTPSGRLAALLDTMADRESRSGAWIWRFTSSSVRRAFDSGATAENLLTSLREVAVGGRLPQPLEYLIGDVARRHGTVRVRPAACCLRCDDPVLLNEILRAKGLAKLRLAAVSDTVLTSAVPVAATLEALRAAGYAPAAENEDGTPRLERVESERATNPAMLAGSGARTPGPPMGIFDEYPDELIDELMETYGAAVPAELLQTMRAIQSGAPLPAVSEPNELAAKLLSGGAKGPGNRGNRGRRPRR